MTAELREKRARRNELREELRDLDARVRWAGGDVAGIEERAGNVRTGLARLDVELREDDLAALKRAAADPRHLEDGSFHGEPKNSRRSSNMTLTTNTRDGAREAAVRSLDKAYERNAIDGPSGERLVDLIDRDQGGVDAQYIAAISDPAYERAFARTLSNPNAGAGQLLAADEAEAMQNVARALQFRAMAIGEGSTGGYAVPLSLDPTVQLTSDGVLNPLRKLASVQTIATSEWAGVTSAGVTAGFVAEGTEASDNSPTLAQPKIKPEKAQAFVPFSIEVGMDWGALQAELAKLFADAKDTLEGEKFTSGDGTDEPAGIVTGATEAVTTAAEGKFEIPDVYSTLEALGARWQPRASWLASGPIANVVYRFVGTDSEEPLLMNPDRTSILGKPYSELSTMQATVTKAKVIALYGDIAAGFKIVDRIGMQVELIPHLMGENGRPTGERGLYAFWRTGSKVVNAKAIRALKVKAS